MIMMTDPLNETESSLIFSRQFIPPQEKEQFSCIIIGDEPEYRSGLIQQFESIEKVQIIAAVPGIDHLHNMAEGITPDLAVVQIKIGGKNPIKVIRKLKKRFPGMLVLVKSNYNVPELVKRILIAGANGYLMYGTTVHHLQEAVVSMLAGKVYIDPALYTAFLSNLMHIDTPPGQFTSEVGGLSETEFSVFIHLGHRLSRKEIARRAELSVSSVAVYLKRIRNRLDLADNAALKQYAVQWVATFLDH